MGQRLSVSKEQENELYNFLQIPQPQPQPVQQSPQAHQVVMMRMMAPTALGPNQHVIKPNAPVKKQRMIAPTPLILNQHAVPPVSPRKRHSYKAVVNERRSPVRHRQQVGQQHLQR